MEARRDISKWTYCRLEHPIGIEASDWRGAQSPTLAPHFHDETQISIIFSGGRFFQIGARLVQVNAGSFVIIPAGVPHSALGVGTTDTMSKDIFVGADNLPEQCTSKIITGPVKRGATVSPDAMVHEFLERVARGDLDDQTFRLEDGMSRDVSNAVRASDHSIAEIARQSGYSREGFIRKFARDVGITPHAYRIAGRASIARALLRENVSPAAAAHDAGFADQSHLGRVFKTSFGTTPAAFRRVWSG